ncbi:MAG TPA: protein-glutamate O-methyltransferase CheR [Verrucomicrobiae bacterium]|nr:protein-glutamate O-methyltransferase CheR [Verrucomicrobiae bacterium]
MHTAQAAGVRDLSPESFARLAKYITGELGIKMPDSKATMVQGRLLSRVRALGLSSVEQYGEYFFASANSRERELFINAVTTNKTDFFREPEQFEYLTAIVLPSLGAAGRGPGWRLKVWSAGCSSGEEPYTLAMVLSEYALDRPGFDFAILGTDVSTRVLEQTRRGIYPESQIAPVPPALRRKYFWRSRNGSESLVRVAPELRRKITLHCLNFMDRDYGIRDRYEVVFFRNVMIYFDRPTQEAVVNRICRHLAPGGFLFVGHSESLIGLDIPVRLAKTSVFQKPL